MRPSLILLPLAGMFVLTLVVWLNMFYQRITVIRATGVRPASRADLDKYPPRAVNSSANFQNLFEVPVIFYACVLALLVTNHVDTLHILCAFGFFLFRILHSAIHCSYNDVNQRFTVYAIAALLLWIMVLRFAIAVIGDALA